MASISASTPLRGTSLPTKVTSGPSSRRPSRSRASERSRGMKTLVSAPFGTTSTGRRGDARRSAAAAIAALTAVIWSIDATASATWSRERPPRAGTSSTSARWVVASTGTQRSSATFAAAQPSGTSMWAWITSKGQRS